MSLRSEDADDFRPSAGDDDRLRLAELELRRIELGGSAGDEGVRRGSVGFLGERMPGDCGSGVFVAVWSERRFSGCERRFASLFVCRATRGVPLPAAGPVRGGWLCIVTVSNRAAMRVALARVSISYRCLDGEGNMTMHHVARSPGNQNRVH
jgi:hypothetical protein